MTNESLKRPNYSLYKASQFLVKKETNNFTVVIKNKIYLCYTIKNPSPFLGIKDLFLYNLMFEFYSC